MFHSKCHNVIGVDVASRKLDIHDLQSDKHRIIDNSQSAIAQFAQKYQAGNQPVLVVMEATGS